MVGILATLDFGIIAAETTLKYLVNSKSALEKVYPQIYVVICERCANLMDAADEMERLMLTEFKNICLNE